jgi:hypothetical protein
MAFVVTTGEREKEKIIGSSFYVVNPSTNMADVAYMILHEWQGMVWVQFCNKGWLNMQDQKG